MSELEYCAFCEGGYAHSGICDKCTTEIGQTGKELADKDRQLAEARARIDHLERIIDEMTEEQASLCAEGQSITELVAAKDKLIEQMREALNILVANATPSGPLWHGSAEMQIARAALSAAERGE